MYEALAELQTLKYWVLAAITVILGVCTNLLTDWLKLLWRAPVTYEFFANSKRGLTSPAVWYFLTLWFVSIQAFFLFQVGYFWTPKIIALGGGLFTAISIMEAVYQSEVVDDADKPKLAKTLAFEVAFKFWFLWFGLPRMAYWLVEWGYLTNFQVLSMSLIVLVAALVRAKFWKESEL